MGNEGESMTPSRVLPNFHRRYQLLEPLQDVASKRLALPTHMSERGRRRGDLQGQFYGAEVACGIESY